MYKTAVITDEISQDLTVAAQLAVEYGLNGLEIRSVKEHNPFQMSKDEVDEVGRIAKAHGLEICSVGAPLFKCALDDDEAYKAHVAGFGRCIDAAHLWGTRLIRGFTFWKDGNGVASYPKIAQRYQEIIRMAEENDVVVVVESEPSVCTVNMEMLAQFLELVHSDRVAALWDPGNEVADPGTPPPYPTGYERLKPYIKHVHLKDAKSTTDHDFYEPALIGRGDVDFHGALNRLQTDGYEGYVSIETHYRMHKKQMLEDQLVQPQGSGFSDGGYEATRAYLELLRDEYNWMGGAR